jgi:hypothetical protein
MTDSSNSRLAVSANIPGFGTSGVTGVVGTRGDGDPVLPDRYRHIRNAIVALLESDTADDRGADECRRALLRAHGGISSRKVD